MTGDSTVDLSAQGGPLKGTDNVGWAVAAVDSAGLRHRVADAPSVIEAHDVEVAEEHLRAGRVVDNDRAQGSNKGIGSGPGRTLARSLFCIQGYEPAGPNADATDKGIVIRRISLQHQFSGIHHAGVQDESALDDVCFDALDDFRDLLFGRYAFFLRHVHANRLLRRSIAANIFVTDIDTRHARSPQEIGLGLPLYWPDFAHSWHRFLLKWESHRTVFDQELTVRGSRAQPLEPPTNAHIAEARLSQHQECVESFPNPIRIVALSSTKRTAQFLPFFLI